jgi:hypothetical protein
MTALTAWRSPRWASAMTSCTPASPQALSDRKNPVPERAVLGVTHCEAKDLTAAVTADAGGDDHGLRDDPAVDPSLAIGGVDEHIWEGLAG